MGSVVWAVIQSIDDVVAFVVVIYGKRQIANIVYERPRLLKLFVLLFCRPLIRIVESNLRYNMWRWICFLLEGFYNDFLDNIHEKSRGLDSETFFARTRGPSGNIQGNAFEGCLFPEIFHGWNYLNCHVCISELKLMMIGLQFMRTVDFNINNRITFLCMVG